MKVPKTAFSCQRGNLTIRGFAFGESAPGKPAVIVSHGFLANQSTTRDYAVALAEQGFGLIAAHAAVAVKKDGRILLSDHADPLPDGFRQQVHRPRDMALRIVLRVPKIDEHSVWRALIQQNPLIDILHAFLTPSHFPMMIYAVYHILSSL